MSKSTVTREQLRALAVKKIESLKFAITQSAFTNIRRGLEEELQLAKFALAAMDSESQAPKNSDQRDAFEAVFPMPKHAQRCGKGYACTAYSAWDAQNFIQKWEGWNACHASMAKNPTEKSAFLRHAERLATDAKELAERVKRNDVTALTTSEEHRQLRDLVMMVKMLCRTVRKYNPESQQAANFTAYLQKEGLISAADCLRDSARQDTDSEDSRG
ncbi:MULTISPECIES: hypothetical protein [Bacteria]|jgi:hypothetical protein|uniref:hypothetical protein n=1 Tax=Bacteria TaxID=2 RepID=UPI00065217CE|nr:MULTISPECIES: hypothetical protein [Bacteria]AUV95452.1 hypothetical protein C2U44_31090 [Klebsiella oxytoca]ELS5458884.1 hypothetical protein [Raoultella ornithinolytica]EME8857493.1 hypothetical protein [Klebsiella aerogenes]DAM09654.1 MAG TPA: hypothetical protein [Caudoviricetes sp.]KMI89736.1 hypothetical protein SN01_05429 [Klebsiella pneumoniae]